MRSSTKKHHFSVNLISWTCTERCVWPAYNRYVLTKNVGRTQSTSGDVPKDICATWQVNVIYTDLFKDIFINAPTLSLQEDWPYLSTKKKGKKKKKTWDLSALWRPRVAIAQAMAQNFGRAGQIYPTDISLWCATLWLRPVCWGGPALAVSGPAIAWWSYIRGKSGSQVAVISSRNLKRSHIYQVIFMPLFIFNWQLLYLFIYLFIYFIYFVSPP